MQSKHHVTRRPVRQDNSGGHVEEFRGDNWHRLDTVVRRVLARLDTAGIRERGEGR